MKPSAFPRNRDAGMVRLYAWVMVFAVGLTVAFAVSASRTEAQYSASAEILMGPTITPSGNYIQPSMPTEQRVATSTDVIATTAARLGGTSAQVLEQLSVTVPVDTQVLVLTYTASTRAEAWTGANTIAETYLQYRNPADGKNPVASLVGPPEIPSAPTTANYPVVLAVAVLGGLLIGFAIAWTWDRVRGRIRTIADAERRTDRDALAVLARRSWSGRQVDRSSRSNLDSLAARVLGQVEGGPRPSVLVTGVAPGCGSTTAAVQMAIALARLGRVVFLVTADRDVIAQLSHDRGPARPDARPDVRPGEHPAVREDHPGPARDSWPAAAAARLPRLHPVPVAEWDEDGVATSKLANLLPELHDRLPEAVVVIDGPPAWQSAGMALRADKILLVVELGRSTRASTEVAVQALDHCAEKLMGLVIRPQSGHLRTALASVRAWASLRGSRIMSRVAPPAPASLAPQGPVSRVTDLASLVPRLQEVAPKRPRRPRAGAPPTLRGWTGPLGREDQLMGAIASDRVCDLGRVPVSRSSSELTSSKLTSSESTSSKSTSSSSS